MLNRRFNEVASAVILGCLVLGASGVIWFSIQAYAEISEIQTDLAATNTFNAVPPLQNTQRQ